LRPKLLGREMGNPFVDGIDYDYGYGKVGRLGMKLEQFAREQAHILDDLYLFELLIRLDESIDEVERSDDGRHGCDGRNVWTAGHEWRRGDG